MTVSLCGVDQGNRAELQYVSTNAQSRPGLAEIVSAKYIYI